jgi:hypothetical protein
MLTHLSRRRLAASLLFISIFGVGLFYAWRASRWYDGSAGHHRVLDMRIPENLSGEKLLAKDFDLSSNADVVRSTSLKMDAAISNVDATIKAAKVVAPVLDVAVAYRDLASKVYRGINDLEIMPVGSLVKVAVMIATLKKMEEQPELRQSLVKYNASELPPVRIWDLPFFHPAPEREIYDQQTYTLDQLLFKMVALSSNRVAAILYGFVKPEFDAVYNDSGLTPPMTSLPELNAKDSLRVFELLFSGQYLSESSSRKGLYILSQSDFDAGLQAPLPRFVRIAHKFGTNLDDRGTYWLHECGIIYTARPYELCVFTKGSNLYEMRDLIQTISKQIYEAQVGSNVL